MTECSNAKFSIGTLDRSNRSAQVSSTAAMALEALLEAF